MILGTSITNIQDKPPCVLLVMFPISNIFLSFDDQINFLPSTMQDLAIVNIYFPVTSFEFLLL